MPHYLLDCPSTKFALRDKKAVVDSLCGGRRVSPPASFTTTSTLSMNQQPLLLAPSHALINTKTQQRHLLSSGDTRVMGYNTTEEAASV